MAADKARLLDKPGGVDGLGAKAQVGDGARARLLGVVDEVALGVEALQLADDLDAVLVGAHRAIGTEAEESARTRLAGSRSPMGCQARLRPETSSTIPTVKRGRGASEASSSNTAAHMAG